MAGRQLTRMEVPARVLILGKSLCTATLAEHLRRLAEGMAAPLDVTLESPLLDEPDTDPDVIIVCASACAGQEDPGVFSATMERYPGSRLIAMSPRAHALNLVTAIDAGAKGFIACGIDDMDDVVSALVSVLQDQIAFSTDVSRLIVTALRTAGVGRRGLVDGEPSEQGLTDRERDVLELLCGGKSNQQIATELNISANTVKNHLARAYRKLGVNSRGEAISLAVRQNLV